MKTDHSIFGGLNRKEHLAILNSDIKFYLKKYAKFKKGQIVYVKSRPLAVPAKVERVFFNGVIWYQVVINIGLKNIREELDEQSLVDEKWMKIWRKKQGIEQ